MRSQTETCVTFKNKQTGKHGCSLFCFNGFSLMVPDFVFRVCKTFFPPIPSPPPKYMYFLEKSNGFNVSRRKNSHQSHFLSPHHTVEAFVCVCLSRSIILAHQSRRRWSVWFYASENRWRTVCWQPAASQALFLWQFSCQECGTSSAVVMIWCV